MVKGRSDRIGAIHAVYGLAWAGLAYSIVPGPLTTLLLVAGTIVTLLGLLRLKRTRSAAPPGEKAVGTAIRRINVMTGIAVVAVIVILHGLGGGRYLVPAVLAVMALHFLPLWRLLGRVSLGVMGAALMAGAAIGLVQVKTGFAPILASAIFLTNGFRLSVRRHAPAPGP